jgi:hypothetical protein
MLDPISTNSLYQVRAVLAVAIASGLDIDALLTIVDAELTVRQNQQTSSKKPSDPVVKGCPRCGKPLQPVVNDEGLNILGCRSCRYSKIVEAL